MSETSLMIPSGNLLLEALWDDGDGADTAVICHPHPLYGGSMDNNVVAVLQKTLRNSGWATLRFNFRGVGASTGNHKGAQGDVEDLLSVFQTMQQQARKDAHLAGYSYGAWIGLRAMKQGLHPKSAILVSPPLDFLDFKGIEPPLIPCLVTVGDQDDFCSVESLRTWLASQPATEGTSVVEILPGCDHFYWDSEKLLATKVSGFLRNTLAGKR
jgi:uncharacterized protein